MWRKLPTSQGSDAPEETWLRVERRFERGMTPGRLININNKANSGYGLRAPKGGYHGCPDAPLEVIGIETVSLQTRSRSVTDQTIKALRFKTNSSKSKFGWVHWDETLGSHMHARAVIVKTDEHDVGRWIMNTSAGTHRNVRIL